MKIVGVKDDDLFKDALKAIDNIESFMARHHPGLTPTVIKNAVGDIPAIRAENRLLVACRFMTDQPIEPNWTLDGERVLQEIIRKGTHILTDDNSICFYEYSPREGSNRYAFKTFP